MRILIVAALLVSHAGTIYADPVQWPVEEGGNGHWYDLRLAPGDCPWECTRERAEGHIVHGVHGHLVTITSQAEQEWITETYGCSLAPRVALGLIQRDHAAEPGQGWRWITGEPFDFTFWETEEPSNGPTHAPEDWGMFDYGTCTGRWNDIYRSYPLYRYLVEYPVEPVPTEGSSWGLIKRAYK